MLYADCNFLRLVIWILHAAADNTTNPVNISGLVVLFYEKKQYFIESILPVYSKTMLNRYDNINHSMLAGGLMNGDLFVKSVYCYFENVLLLHF